ncbi:MAG: RsmB/NOP family class I SAM-dependent RNA methyltransferase [Candidatus Competibacterales bacterium]
MSTPADLAVALARYRPLLADWPALIDTMAKPLPGCLWANPLRITPTALAALLAEEGLATTPLPWQPQALTLAPKVAIGHRWWYLAGLAHSQEAASLVPVALLAPRPGERVLDLCAAPGGKAALMALALANRGTLVANDVTPGRLQPLRANLERLGLVNVTTTCYDGANYPGAAGPFDAVLVDAPCSCEGTLRRGGRATAYGADYLEARFARLQRALLRRAVALCRPGGRIVYATCTLAPEENEAVVDAVLAESQGAVSLVPAAIEGLVTRPGVIAWRGQRFHHSLGHCLRLWPQDNDSGGFFAAVLVKAAATRAATPRWGTAEAAAPSEPWRLALQGRFAIQDPWFEDLAVARRNHRGLFLSAADHRPPQHPPPQSIGLLAVKTNGVDVKPSTAGALLMASAAGTNGVELGDGQVADYLHRRSVTLSPRQHRPLAERGYVVVYHRGYGLGTGVLDGSGTQLQSLFPKRWGVLNPGQTPRDPPGD